MREEIQIKQAILGLKPFILIEFTSVDAETGEIGLNIEYGGGVISEDLPELLGAVRESVEEQLA